MLAADFPVALRALLQAVAWRQTFCNTLATGFTAIAAVGLCGLIWLVTDAFVPLIAPLRGLGVWTAITTGVVVLLMMARLRRQPSNADIARAIEQSYPELQERLSTCQAQLSEPIPRHRTEQYLWTALQRETHRFLEQIDPTRVVSEVSWQRAAGSAATLAMVMLALFLWWGEGLLHLMARWWTPWENHGWHVSAEIITHTPRGFALRDQDYPLAIELRAYRPWATVPSEIMLCWRESSQTTWHERPLIQQDDGHFTGAIPHLTQNVAWKIRARNLESPLQALDVIDPPHIMSLTAVVDPPGYSGRSSEQRVILQELSVLAGSRVRLFVTWDRPVIAAELHWPGEGQAGIPFMMNRDGRSGSVMVTANESGPFSLRMQIEQQVEVDEAPRTLVVQPDQPPSVRILGPASLALRPDDRQGIRIQASDDFGLTAAELQLEVAGVAQPPRKIPLGKVASAAMELRQTVDFQAWNLAPGASVIVKVRAFDNRESPGPQEGWSTPLVIVISPSALPEEVRRLAEHTQQARDGLGQILRDLDRERSTLRDIHQKTAAATVREKPAQQEARLQTLAREHQDLRNTLEDWTAMLPDDEPGQALREGVERVQAGVLSAAANKLNNAPRQSQRDQIPTLSQALDDLAAARTALKQVDDALLARAALGDDLQRLRQMAHQSDRTADELSADTAPDTQENAIRVVQSLQQELTKIVQRRPEWQAALVRAEQDQQKSKEPVSALTPENQVPSVQSKPTQTSPQSMQPVPKTAGAELANARHEFQQAEANLLPMMNDPLAAVDSLQAASRALHAVVAQTAGSPSRESEEPMPSPSLIEDRAAMTAAAGSDPATATLATAPIPGDPRSNRNWGRLPAGLKTQMLQGHHRTGHADYAQQVRRYFERIAQPESNAPSESKP